MYLKKIFLLLCGFYSIGMVSQVHITSFPKDLQFFARDTDNFGRFEIRGISGSSVTLKTVISKSSNAEITDTIFTAVNVGGTFTIHVKIPSQLEEFNLELYAIQSPLSDTLLKRARYLVAGDFFIVAGQSNAESNGDLRLSSYDSMYKHSCNRAIGANFSWATGRTNQNIDRISLTEDCLFGRPSVLFWADGNIGFTGVWPLKLQYQMAVESGIPVCFVNGSIGGSRISENQASHTPSLPESLRHSNDTLSNKLALPYDRMFHKLYVNQAIKGVKGIFWYQGESDGNFTKDTALNYDAQFEKLLRSWKSDYPNLKKIIVLQINVGCAGNYLNMIRETQRKLQDKYAEVVVMTTVGSDQDDRATDLCHYTLKGYEKIVENVLPLVKKHIYGQTISDDLIMPANIRKAYYTSRNQMCLEFNKNILCQLSTEYELPKRGVAYLKDYFYDEHQKTVLIESIEQKNNFIYLNLEALQAKIKLITYLPLMFTTIPSGYAGPWILNAENTRIGAYSFDAFPVETPFNFETILYPNPAQQTCEIRYETSGGFFYQIIDLFGKPILSGETSENSILVNLETLISGVYLVQITHRTGIVSTRLVVD